MLKNERYVLYRNPASTKSTPEKFKYGIPLISSKSIHSYSSACFVVLFEFCDPNVRNVRLKTNFKEQNKRKYGTYVRYVY
jgi:hypothetical protein